MTITTPLEAALDAYRAIHPSAHVAAIEAACQAYLTAFLEREDVRDRLTTRIKESDDEYRSATRAAVYKRFTFRARFTAIAVIDELKRMAGEV